MELPRNEERIMSEKNEPAQSGRFIFLRESGEYHLRYLRHRRRCLHASFLNKSVGLILCHAVLFDQNLFCFRDHCLILGRRRFRVPCFSSLPDLQAARNMFLPRSESGEQSGVPRSQPRIPICRFLTGREEQSPVPYEYQLK